MDRSTQIDADKSSTLQLSRIDPHKSINAGRKIHTGDSSAPTGLQHRRSTINMGVKGIIMTPPPPTPTTPKQLYADECRLHHQEMCRCVDVYLLYRPNVVLTSSGKFCSVN